MCGKMQDYFLLFSEELTESYNPCDYQQPQKKSPAQEQSRAGDIRLSVEGGGAATQPCPPAMTPLGDGAQTLRPQAEAAAAAVLDTQVSSFDTTHWVALWCAHK